MTSVPHMRRPAVLHVPVMLTCQPVYQCDEIVMGIYYAELYLKQLSEKEL